MKELLIVNRPSRQVYIDSSERILNLSFDNLIDVLSCIKAKSSSSVKKENLIIELAKDKLGLAMFLAQQGAEIAIKGDICSVSPLLLLDKIDENLAKANRRKVINFDELKTKNASILISLSESARNVEYSTKLKYLYNEFRISRNDFTHATYKDINVNIIKIIKYIFLLYEEVLRISIVGSRFKHLCLCCDYFDEINSKISSKMHSDFFLLAEKHTPSEDIDDSLYEIFFGHILSLHKNDNGSYREDDPECYICSGINSLDIYKFRECLESATKKIAFRKLMINPK